MYIASADRSGLGTTNLHQDVASAVNILVWCDGDGAQPGAKWTIFRGEDTDALNAYLRETRRHEHGDPILSAEYSLTSDDLTHLRSRGVHAFEFVQRKGDTVLIHAGCAHQVSSPLQSIDN